MVNISNLKKIKKTLGQAPSFEEASNNISAPEVAPPASSMTTYNQKQDYLKAFDGRTMRKTRRVHRLGLAVTAEFDSSLREIAMRKNMLIVEVLEEALELYKQHMKNNGEI